jgi:hypothetical protein
MSRRYDWITCRQRTPGATLLSCVFAPEAVRQLRGHGYTARHLIDGLPKWAAAGNRLESVVQR